jgi:alpha-1,6-mannosyltransferase
MKILDICAFYAPKGGGVRTYVERKLKAGAALGHEIVIVAPGEVTRTETRGAAARIEWIRSPRFPLDFNYRYFDDNAAVHALLDREAPDVIEVSSPWRSPSIVADWNGKAVRSLVMHADPLSAYAYRWFDPIAERSTIDRYFDVFWRHLRRLDAAYDIVVSASDGLSERLRAGGLCNVTTNPMGVDPGIFSPQLKDPDLHSRLLARCGLQSDATLLLGVGRLSAEKRWPLVINAVAAAGARHPVGLMLVGDGRERQTIIRAIGGNPHIQLLAPITDRTALATLIASASALIHGCEAETFCMVAAEALASGLPLIVPDQGGAGDQAQAAGQIRYLSGNVDSAAAAIDLFISEQTNRPRPSGLNPRTMDDHFADLFAEYERLASPTRLVA